MLYYEPPIEMITVKNKTVPNRSIMCLGMNQYPTITYVHSTNKFKSKNPFADK